MRWLVFSSLLLLALPAAAQQGQPLVPDSIAVEATAEVQVAPDRAVVRFGVQQQHQDARQAQQRVNAAMEKVMAAVRKAGIPAKQIATERLELHPVYDHERQPDVPWQGPRLVGFRASNVVRVELPIEAGKGAKVGEVIDAAIGAGANTVEGISFEIVDPHPHQLRAMAQAAQRAQAKAKVLAEALGVRMGRLLQATEGLDLEQPPVPFVAMERKALAAATPISPGELTIRATVRVRYEVQGR